MNSVTLLVHAVKTAMRRSVSAGDMVAVIRKLLARRQPRCFADNFVTFNHQPCAVGVQDDPLSPEQRHATVGGIMNGDEINERVRLVGRQAGTAVMITQLVERSREAGQFVRAGHAEKESR